MPILPDYKPTVCPPPILVRHAATFDPLSHCHLVFVVSAVH
jgi:hypothetical protein